MANAEKQIRTPKAQRWGNSIAVRLPSSLLVSTGIREGSSLEISRNGDGLLIRPIQEKKKSIVGINPYSESTLLKGLTPDKAHADEVAQPTGKEFGVFV
jgi:antitoxin MazE